MKKADTIERKLDNIYVDIGSIYGILSKMDDSLKDLERHALEQHTAIPATSTPVPDARPFNNENQPMSFFGPSPVSVQDYMGDQNLAALRSQVVEELEEFTDLRGGFAAMAVTTDKSRRFATGDRAVCYFSDDNVVAVNNGGLCMVSPSKPMLVGGSVAASGVYVPFAISCDPEGAKTAQMLVNHLANGMPVPMHVFCKQNDLIG